MNALERRFYQPTPQIVVANSGSSFLNSVIPGR